MALRVHLSHCLAAIPGQRETNPEVNWQETAIVFAESESEKHSDLHKNMGTYIVLIKKAL